MAKPWARASLYIVVFCPLLGVTLLGCKSWSERGAKGLGTLPPASPNETRFSPYQPAHPYQQLAKGLLGRKLLATSAEEAGAVIEVDDFLVGPRQKTESYRLPAASIFQVQSGAGVLSLEDKPQKIEAGTVVSLAAAQPFTIENQADTPIAIRVTILGRK